MLAGLVPAVIAAVLGTAAHAQSTATSPALSTAVSVQPPDDPPPPDVLPPAEPGGTTPPPPPVAAALPAGSGVLDSATVQRIVDRLVGLHLLASAADAQDADTFTQAIRDFQASAGISPSGTLDRDTVGRLTTP